MSASFDVLGGQNGPVYTAVTTGGVDIATPTGTSIHKLIGVRIVNIDDANPCRCELFWNDGSNDRQFYNANIAAGASDFVDDPIIFGTDQIAKKLRAMAGANDDIVVTVYVAVSTGGK